MNLEKLGGKYSGIYINKLKSGDISYYISYRDDHGKVKRKSVGKTSKGMNKSKALSILNDTKLRVRKSEESEIEISTKSLNDLSVKYFEDKKVAGNSISREISRYKHVQHYIWASRQVRKIRKDNLNKLVEELQKKGLALSSVKKIVDLCRAIVNHSIKNKYYFGNNQFEKVEMEKFDNQRTRFLSHNEVALLLNALYGYKNVSGRTNDNLYILGVLALNTGARKETIFSIKYKDINFDSGVIELFDHKDKSKYVGFLADEEVLKYLHDKSFAEKGNTYILNNGNPNKKLSDIPRPFKNILEELFNQEIEDPKDLDRVVFHTLRHTFASLLVQNGVPIFTVKKLLNHSKIESTMRYAKLAPNNGYENVKELWQKQDNVKLSKDDFKKLFELE